MVGDPVGLASWWIKADISKKLVHSWGGMWTRWRAVKALSNGFWERIERIVVRKFAFFGNGESFQYLRGLMGCGAAKFTQSVRD